MTTTITKPERFLKIINEDNSIEADGMDSYNSNIEPQGYEDEGPPSYGTTQRQEQERNLAQLAASNRERTLSTRTNEPANNTEPANIELTHRHGAGKVTELSINNGGGGINLIVGNHNAVNIGSSGSSSVSQSPPSKQSLSPPEITDSEEMVSVGMGQYVSSNLGSLWKRVGRILGLTDADLDYIDLDNLIASEKAYDMIRKWRQSRGREASYKALAMALVNADPRLYDLAASVSPNGISV
ncbi:DgyrCDS6404 [Dimorphilus gyrociliatus]|uniref:DgyrCDS6404 n=1 Tax=Dimorphilus gyrociliatus TaxID=2664684 RepID=A0A7I8VMY7_9ANNE|nr:DgyrCDS6404 [Dimorphilus gyrociliatus]